MIAPKTPGLALVLQELTAACLVHAHRTLEHPMRMTMACWAVIAFSTL